MTVFITMGPNVIANEEAAQYPFPERPYFCCDRRLNPANEEEMTALFRIRRALIGEYLAAADGFVLIDSDPGGYIGSNNAEFVALLRRHLALFAETSPQAYLYYWMWFGWETYNRFWEDVLAGKTRFNWSTIGADCEAAVRLLLEHPEERWRLFCCMNDVHKPIISALGVQARTLYNPYGLIELEPSVPLTNYSPEKIAQGLAQYDRALTPLGVFGNAQSHVVQLPNTYIFAHLAQGGSTETLDVPGFAEELLPGMPAHSWRKRGQPWEAWTPRCCARWRCNWITAGPLRRAGASAVCSSATRSNTRAISRCNCASARICSTSRQHMSGKETGARRCARWRQAGVYGRGKPGSAMLISARWPTRCTARCARWTTRPSRRRSSRTMISAPRSTGTT